MCLRIHVSTEGLSFRLEVEGSGFFVENWQSLGYSRRLLVLPKAKVDGAHTNSCNCDLQERLFMVEVLRDLT